MHPRTRAQIDLTFARLNMERVPEQLDLREVPDAALLAGLDEKCVRSINGAPHTDTAARPSRVRTLRATPHSRFDSHSRAFSTSVPPRRLPRHG